MNILHENFPMSHSPVIWLYNFIPSHKETLFPPPQKTMEGMKICCV